MKGSVSDWNGPILGEIDLSNYERREIIELLAGIGHSTELEIMFLTETHQLKKGFAQVLSRGKTRLGVRL